MRYLIIYLLCLYSLSANQIKIPPTFSIDEITEETLEFNLYKNNSLTFNEKFELAYLTSDNKYIIGIAFNKYNDKKSRIFIFDTKTKEIIKIIEKDYKITAITSFKNAIFLGDSKGYIEKILVKDLLQTNLIDKNIIYNVNGRVKKLYIEDDYSIIDFYREQNKTKDHILKFENKNQKTFQEIVIDNQTVKEIIEKINIVDVPLTQKDNLKHTISSIIQKNNKNTLFIKKNFLLQYDQHSYSLYFCNQYSKNNNSEKLYTIIESNSTKIINSISISEDKKYLLISENNEIKMYDIFNQNLISSYQIIPTVTNIVFTKNERYMIISTNTGYIHVWDIKINKLISIIKAHNKKITSMDINEDGKYLATGSEDDFIKIWNIENIENIQKYKKYDNERDIIWLYFDKSGITYKDIKKEKNFYNFKLKENNEKYKGEIQNHSIDESKDNKYIFYIKRKKIKLHDLEQNRYITFSKNETKKTCLKISPNNNYFIVSDINGNIFIYNRDGNLSKIFKSKDDGSWIVIDKKEMKVIKGDMSKLWFQKYYNECNKYDENEIEIIFPKNINIIEGKENKINITIKNKTDKTFSFIQMFLKENRNFILKPNSLRKLESNQIIEQNLSILYIGDINNSQNKLIFKAKINRCEVINNYSSIVHIKKFALDIEKVAIDSEENKMIYLKNIGDINLTFNMFIDNENQRHKHIKIHQTKRILFSDFKENTIVRGIFLNINPPYNKWDFNKTMMYEESIFKLQTNDKEKNQFVGTFVIVMWLIVFIYILNFIWIRIKIAINPNYLFKISPHKLKRKRIFLNIFLVYNQLLRKADIPKAQVDFTIEFLEKGLNKNNDFFKKRLKKNIERIDNQNRLYHIILSKKFLLNISQFYLCLKDDDNLIDMEKMRHKNLFTIIISKRQKIQREIIRKNEFAKTNFETNSLPHNRIITPTLQETMELLLARDYEEALIKILVKYIAPKHISPFDSKVSKYQYMEQKKKNIIHNLTSKKLKNLLIVGADKSGKSYLLKKIEESLKETSSKNIVYFIQKNTYESIYQFINKKMREIDDNDNNLIFLIDDIDNFILDKEIYRIFFYFKEFYEQKNIFFIMTGFWTLYKEIYIEEKSPLKSFAIDKYISDHLDSKSSKEMIKNYMNILNIKFESDDIIDDIIYQTGGKLELINLICHKLIKHINYDEKIIYRKIFENVLNNKKVLNYIDTLNSFNDALERIIIYGMIKKTSFSHKDIIALLNEYAIHISSKEIECYLKKLELYNILEIKDDNFRYKIPLLQQKISKQQNIQHLLEEEAKNYKDILPNVKKILSNPIELYEHPYLKLNTIYKQLENLKRIDSIINILEIGKKSFEIVRNAFRKKSHQAFENMIRLFSEKINGSYSKEKNYFLIKVNNNNFPLNIPNNEFIIHFSNEKDYKNIKSFFSGSRITILITTRSIEAQNNLYEKTLDKTDKFIAPKAHAVTKLFLNPSTQKVLKLLSDIFLKHLRLEDISPYQSAQSIDNPLMFFGREKIMAQIIQREPKNYLVMGARRVGKSSLLKALHRKLKDNPTINSYYFALSEEPLEEKIIKGVLGLNHINTFKELKIYLKKQNKPYIFLIDETDDFIMEDETKKYNILKILREMSEEKYAFFILAGFWQLYKSKWEQQSPLLNFGDSIEIGELEFNACKELIRKPMQIMHIEFKNERLIEDIVYQLGQKAQLISLMCHILVEIASNTNFDRYYITENDILKAFEDKRLKEELGKWIKLEENEEIQLLIKIIVYSMLPNNTFDLSDIQTFLQKQKIYINYKKIEDALQILELGFILKEENRIYSFRIPKQRELWLSDNIRLKLDNDIDDFKKIDLQKK